MGPKLDPSLNSDYKVLVTTYKQGSDIFLFFKNKIDYKQGASEGNCPHWTF